MFGTFTEKALLAYAEKASEAFRERKVKAHQGTEQHDNLGIGETDHSYIDNEESQDADDYSESWDFTTCIRSNGTFYGIAPGKRCRKGTETKGVSKEDKQREVIKKRVEKKIAESPRVAYLTKAMKGRKNAIQSREDFIKRNNYPLANAGLKEEIAKIKKEIEGMKKDILREKRRIAKQEVDANRKETRAQRLGRMSATKARAEKVLADLRKEKEETDTQRSARQGVFNKSQWD